MGELKTPLLFFWAYGLMVKTNLLHRFNQSSILCTSILIDIYKWLLHVIIMSINLKQIKVKAVINKANGQVNFSLPKKQVCKELVEKAYSGKSIKLFFEDD